MVTPARSDLICCIFPGILKVEVIHARACARPAPASPADSTAGTVCTRASRAFGERWHLDSHPFLGLLLPSSALQHCSLQYTIHFATFAALLLQITHLSLWGWQWLCSMLSACVKACTVSEFVSKLLIFSFCPVSGNLVPALCIGLGPG